MTSPALTSRARRSAIRRLNAVTPRDQRSGNKQVCIGLVGTHEGLPSGFEVFAGSRADVGTVQHIVRVMETKYGQAERIWVIGITPLAARPRADPAR